MKGGGRKPAGGEKQQRRLGFALYGDAPVMPRLQGEVAGVRRDAAMLPAETTSPDVHRRRQNGVVTGGKLDRRARSHGVDVQLGHVGEETAP
jgi:hypothetical protein